MLGLAGKSPHARTHPYIGPTFANRGTVGYRTCAILRTGIAYVWRGSRGRCKIC